ncbi:MAG: glycine cleavage T C-terminal barrel domain-containing protein [Pseudomonadota bacterium]
MPNATGQTGFGTQIRKSPFFNATQRAGATGYSVYNHMYIPRSFGDPEENYWNLINAAILCDVGVERQVEITGPDAARFTQYLTPRDLSSCDVGQCKYVFITDAQGGVINDPVLLRLGENHFWLSLADSDVLLWAKGVQVNSGMDVHVSEPDVSPLQLQGPLSIDIMRAVFGEWIDSLAYFRFREFELDGMPLVISRTGWSSELGYEIFLRDGNQGEALWDRLMAVGGPMGLKPGHTSTIRRIEGGMLSYVADMDLSVNPIELGLDRLLDLDMEADFIGKQALRAIRDRGVTRRQVGIEIHGSPLVSPNDEPWPLSAMGEIVGQVTSAVYSPRLKKNIALALVDLAHSAVGSELEVNRSDEMSRASVVPKPFYDPKKTLATGAKRDD